MRIRKVRSEKEFEEVLDEYITIGYNEKERGEKTAMMMKTEYGGVSSHILIFAFTIWWTFGLGNVLWAIYNYYQKSDKVLIKLLEEE